MSELTEDERDWIADVWDEDTTASAGAFYPVVARIIAARVADALAPVRDLAAEWEATAERRRTQGGSPLIGYKTAAAALRDVLTCQHLTASERGPNVHERP